MKMLTLRTCTTNDLLYKKSTTAEFMFVFIASLENQLNNYLNCLKAVILLWASIIAFYSSVTAFKLNGREIRAVNLNYCGGFLRNIELYMVYAEEGDKLKEFFEFIDIPGDTGPIKRMVIPYNQTLCEGEMQTIELPVKKLGFTLEQLTKFNESLQETSRK
ncbi:uncharacterized protein LOC107882151 isoform X3 [Acyrthosiphon pisum]|uniref:Uncharacterized protein n=1 Tax=Acyrthosiphon pisum TaxID=7029 RepID=A0A8R2H7D9_ACYPI|nr:uncharacterized protein LOC107882151 isoform X3 [Acyrthosiphon pisum]|eukprot:XP_016660770.1 PREDICTED: uncharacterized protein LOC107882151 isoform X3 [Acyrthosiphon pisum]